MAVEVTRKLDVIVPEIFRQYVREQTTLRSALFQSGIVQNMPQLNLDQRSGGDQITMPYWKYLEGDDQVLDSTTDLDVKRVTAAKDIAVLNARALVYGATDLAAAFAGDDPMRAVADMYVSKWIEVLQKCLINTLNGAMGSLEAEAGSPNVLDISALSGNASHIDGASFIDANQRMGDAKGDLVAVAMHSAVEAHLAKNDLIEFIRDSQGNVLYTVFMNRYRVIVDDDMPVTSPDTYTTYLFGSGAVGFGEGWAKVPVESAREPLTNGGEEYLVNRRHFVMHPMGIRWEPASGVPAKDTPSNAELADTGNWTRVWQPKHIRIVKFVHTVA